MRGFGSFRILCVLGIVFLSLASCMPNNKPKADYLDDGDYDDDTTNAGDEDDVAGRSSIPVILRSKPAIIEAQPGDTVELPCHVVNADDIVINWLKGKEMIFAGTLGLSEKRFVRAGNVSLFIRNVTEKDASDRWHCQIVSQTPPLELYHTLRVVEKPKELWSEIQVIPGRHAVANENETLTLGCETNNEPKREIKWSHKGERLHNSNDIEIEGNFLTIKRVTMHSAGRYQCLVEDNSETPPTDAIEVTVSYGPKIDVERQVVHTGTGRRSELTCTVHAHPHARVTWHKDNRKPIIDNGDRFRYVENKSHRTLVIERTTKEDLGQYICKAKNQFGEVSRMIELTGKPSRPRLHGGEVSDDEPTLILKWQVESFAPIVEYRLEYRQKDENEWTVVSPRVTDGMGNQFTVQYSLENLQPGSYEAKLLAKNDYGWSQHSDIHTFRQGYKSERAENVTGSAVTCQPILALYTLLAVAVTLYKSSSL